MRRLHTGFIPILYLVSYWFYTRFTPRRGITIQQRGCHSCVRCGEKSGGFIPWSHTVVSYPWFIPWFHTPVSYPGFIPSFHTLVSYPGFILLYLRTWRTPASYPQTKVSAMYIYIYIFTNRNSWVCTHGGRGGRNA